MHPNHEHMTRAAQDPDAALERRLEVARQSGVPAAPLRAYARGAARARASASPGSSSPTATSSPGVEVETDLGTWHVVETPGHAPSHVCLFQPERRLLISGDHLLGRVSLYYDFGWSPDPAGEFLASLDVRRGPRRPPVPRRPRADVQRRAGHIDANRALVARAHRRRCSTS